MRDNSTVKTIARFITICGLFLVPFTPVIVANSYFFPFITGKAFFFRIAVEIAFAGWVLLALVDKKYRPRKSLVSIVLVAFVAWMFVADTFAINSTKAFWSNFERMEGWVTLVHLLAFFLVASTFLRVEKKWRAWWYTSIVTASYVISYGFLQLAGVAKIHQGGVRLDASLGNAAYLAVFMLFQFFVAGWLAFTTKKKWLRYVLFVFMALSAWILFATATRGTILGLAGGLLLSALLALFTMGKRARTVATGAVILIVMIAGGFLLAKDTGAIRHDPVLGRIASISLADGQTRFTIWNMAWKGFQERPVVGWGQEGFNYVFNKYYNPSLYAQEQWFDRAHNAFIDWLVAGGLPAFLLYLSLFFSAIWVLWKSPFSRVEQIAFTALFAGYAFHNLFVFDNIVSYIGFFAVLALIDGKAGSPIKMLEEAPELTSASAGQVALPVVLVAFLSTMFFVNVPGIKASTGLINALTPHGSITASISAWKDELAHPAFAKQEVREQLLSFSMRVVDSPRVSMADKQKIATLAINEMKKEVAELPEDARIRFELAIGYATFGDYKRALVQIEKARELSPNKETIILEDGLIRLKTGDTKGAAKLLKKAYALAPQFKRLAVYGASGNILAGDKAEANKILLKTFGTVSVDNPALIESYIVMKDYAPLLTIYSARVAKKGSTTSDAFHLALVEALAGHTQKAIAQIRSVITKYPKTTKEGNALIKRIQQGKI